MENEPVWVVLARVEDEDSLFPPEERLDPEFFQEIVGTYDPDFRRAPVISGFDRESGTAGPAHWVGEDLAPLGFVQSLKFDGLNLWGKIEEIKNRVTDAVADGFLQRSIGFWRHSPEVGGKGYLRHFALLGGEQPGIPNLPPLDNFFSVGAEEGQGRIVANAPYEVRSIMNNVEDHMDESLRKEVLDLVADTLKSALPVAEPVAPIKKKDADESALGEEIRSLLSGFKDEMSSQITEVRDLANATAEATAAGLVAARNTVLEGELNKLVHQGKLTPADKARELRVLAMLKTEHQDEHIKDLQTKSAILTERLTERFETVEGKPEIRIDRRMFTFPNQEKIDVRSLQFHKEALSRSKNGADMKAYTEAAYALHGETAPQWKEN